MRIFVFNLVLACATSCAPVLRGPLDSACPEAAAATLDHGYALLQQVLQDESSVTLIFGLKEASESLETLVRNIGDAAATGERAIRQMATLPPAIEWNSTGLPLIEVSARHHIANQQAAGLLLAGDSFELRLLLTQQKACDYISALAITIAAADANAERSAMLTDLAHAFASFDEELRTMVEVVQKRASP